MIKIFHKNAQIFQREIDSCFNARNDTYISFSQEKENYFLIFNQARAKEYCYATIGKATYFNEKQPVQVQGEIVLAKEFVKQLALFKFAFKRCLNKVDKFNIEQKLLIARVQKEAFQKFVRGKVLKLKLQKISKEASLSSLLSKDDLQLSLF